MIRPAAEKRVRFTLDLTRAQHRFLKLFAIDAETDASVVMRALLALLEQDSTVRERIHRQLVQAPDARKSAGS